MAAQDLATAAWAPAAWRQQRSGAAGSGRRSWDSIIRRGRTACLQATDLCSQLVARGGDLPLAVEDETLLWYERLENAADRVAYSASSILTQTVPGRIPLPGRSLKVGLQATF